MTTAEVRARNAGRQVEVPISSAELAELIETGRYARARGMDPGTHYRAELGAGCYHLRTRGRHAWLHVDGWDPRRYPGRHVFETPELLSLISTVATCSAYAAIGGVALIYLWRAYGR